MAIEFQASSFLKRLDVISQTQVPYAAQQSLKRLGWELRAEVGQHLQAIYENPVPITVKSPLYKADGLELRVSIRDQVKKGWPPAAYLYPGSDQAQSNAALITGFQKFLWNRGFLTQEETVLTWATKGRRKNLAPTNQYGNVRPGFVAAVMAALGTTTPGGLGRLQTPKARYARSKYGVTRYFVTSSARREEKGLNRLPPGVWRVQGRQRPELLFGVMNKTATVPRQFEFEAVVRQSTEKLLPGILANEVRRALG